jgi:hypothetical protein
MFSLVLILSLGAPSALKLVAPPELACPEMAKVRAGLIGLGVDLDRRDGTADWNMIDGHVHLRVVRAATASVAEGITEREIPTTTCDDLAQIVALSIERATAPLGEPERIALSEAIDTEGEPVGVTMPEHPTAPERGWGFNAHAGLLLLFSARPEPGGEIGGEAWHPRGWFGGSFVLGLVRQDEFDLQQGGVKLRRAHAALGPALRWELGEYVQLCLALSAALDYIDAVPAGMLKDATSRHDLRVGWRASPWIAIGLGPVELRLEAAARGFTHHPTYQLGGAGDLVTLDFFDFDLLVGIGYRSADARPHSGP